MRSKEFAHDYRYFPDPDLLPVVVDAALREQVRESMPELPEAKRARFVRDLGITPYDADVLAATRSLADYFEAAVKAGAPGKTAANWISTELLGRLNESGKEVSESPVTPAGLAELIGKMDSGEITAATGKKVFARMFETGKAPTEVITEEGYAQISDTGEIERIARAIVAKNAGNVAKYRSGNEGVFKFFVGQVMRETRGQANPQAVNDILKRILSES
jgi:aspartyl-tRNA(Asn)/glutamyl-tRNA(Gln) amidotransferase subunit B